MTDNRVWYNNIQRDAFIERTCARCFQPDQAIKRTTGEGPGCPHLARAEQNKLPAPWTRRRNAPWGETYRCAEFTPKAPVNRRGKIVEEIEPMFDVEPDDYRLIPVEGWEDYRARERKQKEGDHQ